METLKITYKEAGNRLDKALALLLPDKSRSYLTNLIDEGHVLLNGKTVNPSVKVKFNDEVSYEFPEDKLSHIESEDIPLQIVYEDEDILIVDKPQGMVVHPAAGHHNGTLVNAVLNHCQDLSSINGVVRPGIVHRIDKDTSGLICIAKNDDAHQFLADQLKDHSMSREYYALVRGVIKEQSGTVDMPIAREKSNRLKMGVDKDGKASITNFEVVERFLDTTLVRCKLVTGRTHQIRVHMSKIGHPVEGDPLYYGKFYNRIYKEGQLLHAYKLNLTHPRTKKYMSFETGLPKYFLDILDKLREETKKKY